MSNHPTQDRIDSIDNLISKKIARGIGDKEILSWLDNFIFNEKEEDEEFIRLIKLRKDKLIYRTKQSIEDGCFFSKLKKSIRKLFKS